MSIKKEDLKIVFMGTPEYAVESLSAIYEAGFNVTGVFSQPDKPSGRGMKILPTPVKAYAESNNIPVFQPEKLKRDEEQVLKKLEEFKPDVIVVVAYGKILPEYILEYPKYGCINVHGSILPKYRGAAPIQWSIINGDKETGVTIMYMDKGMDTGDMISLSYTDIDEEDTYGSLHDKLAVLGSKEIVNTLNALCEKGGKLDSIPQPDNFTIAPMLSRENTHIDFNLTPESIENLVRGTNPFPTAWCEKTDGTLLKIYKVREIKSDELYEKAELGEVVYLNDKKNILQVKVKTGFVSFEEIKPSGSKKMTAGEYIRGNKIKVGDILK